MKTFHVTITELGSRHREHTTDVIADDVHEAFGKGLRKLFGRRAIWQPDSGLRTGDPSYGYGQVFKAFGHDGFQATSCTNRARYNIE